MVEIALEIKNLLSAEQAWNYQIVPVSKTGNSLNVKACKIPTAETIAELEIILGFTIKVEEIEEATFKQLLSKNYRREKIQGDTSAFFKIDPSEKDFLAQLIKEAKAIDSSDIHFEVFEDSARIRFRIDGQLIERYKLPKEDYMGFVNKIKIQSKLDIAQRRLPQDGRIHYNHYGEKFDLRVSILPTLHGEKVVMRILSNDAANVHLYKVGMSSEDLANYSEGIKKPHGILLISGPTGSGKTTTLYATLKELNKPTNNIVTIEDPIEYTLEGINQVQLKEDIGLGFTEALRSFLRQDPDIIMLGEIRDADTAQMAIRAALTGHLVLSTIHTNSAFGTISRLQDMGVPSFLIAGTLNTSVAQRLVRTLCPECKKENTTPAFGIEKHFEAVGCDHCYHTGYKGRKALFEVVPVDSNLQEEIKAGTINEEKYFNDKGVKSLAENALDLVAQGLTSIEEVYPIVMNK